jgi:hypothetical protein
LYAYLIPPCAAPTTSAKNAKLGITPIATATEGAAISSVVFPTIPDGEVSVGWVIVNPTGTGNFVGGTTALDDGTVVPNAVYVNSGDGFNFNLSTL